MTERPELLLEWLADMAALKREEAARATADAEYFEETIAILTKPRDRYDTVPRSRPRMESIVVTDGRCAAIASAMALAFAGPLVPRNFRIRERIDGCASAPLAAGCLPTGRVKAGAGGRIVARVGVASGAGVVDASTCGSSATSASKIERHFAKNGDEIGYDIPGRKPAPAEPIVTREDQARRSNGAEGVSARDPHTRSDPAGGRATGAAEPALEPAIKAAGGSIPPAFSSGNAPPAAQPKKANGTAPVELTGALKLVAKDMLKWLQLRPATLADHRRIYGGSME